MSPDIDKNMGAVASWRVEMAKSRVRSCHCQVPRLLAVITVAGCIGRNVSAADQLDNEDGGDRGGVPVSTSVSTRALQRMLLLLLFYLTLDPLLPLRLNLLVSK